MGYCNEPAENDLTENFLVFLEYLYSSDCDPFSHVYGTSSILRLHIPVTLTTFDLMRVGSARLVVRILKVGLYKKATHW